MLLIIGFMLVLFIIVAAICIAERDGSEEEKDYPLTFRGFMQIRSDLLKDHRKQPKNHLHSPKTYDEIYTTRKENHYENN